MTATEPLTLQLGSTKTYTRRRVTVLPPTGDDPRVCTLRFVLDKAKRSGETTEVRHYGLQPDTDLKPGEVAAWLLLKDELKGGDDPSPYRVVLLEGDNMRCSCKASVCQVGNCRHRDALAKLIVEGVLS